MSNLRIPDNPTLADFQEYVREMAVERGFNKDDVPKKFMMLFEEVGEFAKTARKSAGMKLASDVAKQDAAAEAADTFIVLLGICNIMGIDLEQAFRDKEEHNKGRVWQ